MEGLVSRDARWERFADCETPGSDEIRGVYLAKDFSVVEIWFKISLVQLLKRSGTWKKSFAGCVKVAAKSPSPADHRHRNRSQAYMKD